MSRTGRVVILDFGLATEVGPKDQNTRGGHVDKGLDVIRNVLDRIGLRLASGPQAALLSLLARRFELRLRGLRFTGRPLNDIPENQLLEWTLAGPWRPAWDGWTTFADRNFRLATFCWRSVPGSRTA